MSPSIVPLKGLSEVPTEPEEEKILSLAEGAPKSIKGKVSPENPCIVKATDDYSRTVLFTLTVPAENSVSVTLNNQVLSLTRADAEDEIRYTFTQKLNKDQITAFTLTANGEAGASFTLAISRMPKEEETGEPETETAENPETAEETQEEKLIEETAETIENEVNEEPAEKPEEGQQLEEKTAEESAKESEEKLTEEPEEEQAAEDPAEKPEEEQQTEEETAEESDKESEEKLTEESEEELPAEESTEETEKTAEESAEESIGEETAEEKQQDEESEEETVKEPIDKETGKESAEGEEQEAETAEKETEEASGQPATEAAEKAVSPAEDPEEAPGEEQQDEKPAGNEEESADDTTDEEMINVLAEEQQEENPVEEAAEKSEESIRDIDTEPEENKTFALPEDSVVDFSISFDEVNPTIGCVAHFKAELTGYEGIIYSLQWQKSLDCEEWEDEEGATQETMDVLMTEESSQYYWRLKVVVDIDENT